MKKGTFFKKARLILVIARVVLRLEGQGADFGEMEVDDYEARADLWLILK